MGSKVFWAIAGAIGMFVLMAWAGKRLESRGRGGRLLRLVPRESDSTSLAEDEGGCA